MLADLITVCRWRREGIVLMEAQKPEIVPLQQIILSDPDVVRELLPTISNLQEKVKYYESSLLFTHHLFSSSSRGTKRNFEESKEEQELPTKYIKDISSKKQ